MSKLGDAFRLSQRLSIAAREEAERLSHPQIDVDHLLLALLLTHGAAGELLRGAGLTLPDVRDAVERVHTERVASLGIAVPRIEPRPLREDHPTEMDFAPRALRLMRELDDQASDLSVLSGLLSEPSGLVLHVLGDLEADVTALQAAATVPAAATPRSSPGPAGDPGWQSLTHTDFVPVDPQQVWRLVEDTARRPEWDPLVRAAEPVGPDRWELTAAHPGADPAGSPLRLRVLAHRAPDLVEWETSWTDRGGRTATQRLRLDLQPATGGTRLAVTMAVRRRRGWRRLVQTLFGPFHRFVVRQVLVGHAAAISRVLR